jgi:NTP pyrophosphatase (non-canonical NTP hydrolase)
MDKNDKNTQIQELKDLLAEFRDKRDWKQFHNPKDLAEAISIEAGELMELFLWQTKEEIADKIKKDSDFKKDVRDELSDVITFSVNFANALDIDIVSAIKSKMEENDKKYPADKARGVATKYNKL